MNKIKMSEITDWDEAILAIDDVSIWGAYFGVELLRHIPIKKNMQILDIGCGTGFPTLEVSQRLGKYSDIYALDPWGRGLFLLNQRAKMRGINNIITIQGVAENIPLENGTLDLIISNNGISACRDKRVVFNECYRVLKTGGKMIFTVLLPESMTIVNKYLIELLHDNGYAPEVQSADIFTQRKNSNEYIYDLEMTGFNIDELEHKEFEMSFVDGGALVDYYMFRLLFVSQWTKYVPENSKRAFMSRLVEKLDMYATKNGGITFKNSYAIMEATKK